MKNKNMMWRWLVLAGLCVWSFMLAWPLGEKLPLGIDLAGGYRFVLDVDYDALPLEEGQTEPSSEQRRVAQDQALEVLRNRIDGAGTREATVYKEPGTGHIVFEIPGVGDDERQQLEDLIQRPAYLEFRLIHEENNALVARLFAEGIAPPGYNIVTVQGNQYYQRDSAFEREGMSDDEYQALVANTGRVSSQYELMLSRITVENYGDFFEPNYVDVRIQLEGTAVRRARPDQDEFGRLQVALSLTPEGARRFFRITSDNIGRRLGIVMDDTLYSAPNIQGAIAGGNAVITGSFTFEEVSSLANALNSGSLPVPIEILMQQQVEPSLGADAVQSGVYAALAGIAVVVIFMLIYYRVSGVIVNLALILDAVLLPLGMMLAAGFLGIFAGGGGAGAGNINALPTLTLPGIAGLVLTIGMAVDANVLIFERIREEQKSGKRFVSAIQSGYEKVFSTIFDANITTLLVAVILFMQGSGPIRGFAVMLTAGILVSMYTALVFTRMGFDLLAAYSPIKTLKMMSILPDDLKIDFLSKRKIAFGISGLLLVATLVNIGLKGSDVLGIDFTGGASMRFSLTSDEDTRPSTGEIETVLGLPEAVIQYQRGLSGEGAGTDTLQVNVAAEFSEQARARLLEAFGEEHGFQVIHLEEIGPQVGAQMRNRGIRAILFALIGIVIYITLRFEFAFAMGTITALAHDVLLTVGIYTLFGRQLSLPIVAALLTIVGYSANDTIVVFDRIREDLKLLKGKPYKDIANISINQTLSRTLLTSVTTLLTVLMLLIFGGGAINDFAFALFIGVLVGTYSSIFVATPVMLLWHKDEKTAKA
ncbi:MAG: protein translocase subunit SecD [Verrucomicrobia bacterium]|nr:protein translocase subunit SecD [Verrucomicrobiota bacterium]MCH8525853.1 protein translocase subunit SecD [Kiritimatiellia bacterium]